MKVSVNWLKKYLDINIPAEELITGLQGIGFDLESVEKQADKLRNFVIGKVIQKEKHPNADKLSLCKVDAGTGEILNIVCGAPNVDAGQTVCVALVGAIVPNGEFEIKKSKIRGEVSEGMICSAKELNLGDDHSGIMVLEDRLPIGSQFAQYLGQDDVIIDFGITPNRGDLLSHIGVAREAGFLLKQTVKEPKIESDFKGSDIDKFINVEIENPDGSYRYCGSMVKDIEIKESPDWLKNKLIAVGLRPINNIVDVTNFVMLECGQPLHAFDYDLIGGKKIMVKNAGSLKSFITLDEKERKLRDDILLICDGEKPVALAGIMGGANSEITANTHNVFIESAYFDPVITRKSSKFLGLQTESSYRFERGVDIERTEWAARRSAELIAELSGGKIVQGIIDVYKKKLEKPQIRLRTGSLRKITGIDFTTDQAKDLLETIGFKCVKLEGDTAEYEIPYFRLDDVQREIDLIEEVLRLYGYEKITDADADTISLDTRDYSNVSYDNVNEIRAYFAGRGFKEIITNTLFTEDDVKLFGDNYLKLLNPFSSQMNTLRTNLILGALTTVQYNLNHFTNSMKLFEIGNVFSGGEKSNHEVIEQKMKILVMAGLNDAFEIGRKDRFFDVFDMRGEIDMLLRKLNIENYKLNDYYYNGWYDSRFDYCVKNKILASVTSFSGEFLRKFDIEKPVVVCEIF